MKVLLGMMVLSFSFQVQAFRGISAEFDEEVYLEDVEFEGEFSQEEKVYELKLTRESSEILLSEFEVDENFLLRMESM